MVKFRVSQKVLWFSLGGGGGGVTGDVLILDNTPPPCRPRGER